jgi:hypothetical protein
LLFDQFGMGNSTRFSKPSWSASYSRWACLERPTAKEWWAFSAPPVYQNPIGILFTYGPLPYFLKNRVYIGETGHKDKWVPGEHAGIVDRKTFDQVQQLLKPKSDGRDATRIASEALLLGQTL